MSFARFMELALYHPEAGYYRQARPRVGYGTGTDFFTSSTSGPVFGELVCAACTTLLGGRNPLGFTFVEIGAEPGQHVLAGVDHPFGAVVTFRPGDPVELKGTCVVFSNELFDAQPFHRHVFRRGRWLELGVALQDDRLVETEIETSPPALLPSSAPEGYIFDAPQGAMSLAGHIASLPWTGLFLACDYGRTFRELAEHYPNGTARAYFRHTQGNDLLARPGEQDLTCHVCWDWLADALTKQGFAQPAIESQESFFVRHAADFIAGATSAEAAHFSPRKLSLLQLLHPSHLGQKFQVLHARREKFPI
jgi:SAM-dependent MidA family methyltransferase